MDIQRAEEIINKYSQQDILVIGDFMLDRYIEGKMERRSPETPLLIHEQLFSYDIPGGAGNTARNARTLGALVWCEGVVGEDADGKILEQKLIEYGINNPSLTRDPSRPTTVKTRLTCDGHMVGRTDNEKKHDLPPNLEEIFCNTLSTIMSWVKVVIISDYAKGVFTRAVADTIRKYSQQYNIPVIADIKPPHKSYSHGFTVIKPNLKEGKEMTQYISPINIVTTLAQELKTNVVLTLSEKGLLAYDRAINKEYAIPARKRDIIDVTGAGDTVTAVLALSIASGATLFEAAYLANAAAGVKVRKQGTATVTREELLHELKHEGQFFS